MQYIQIRLQNHKKNTCSGRTSLAAKNLGIKNDGKGKQQNLNEQNWYHVINFGQQTVDYTLKSFHLVASVHQIFQC